MLGDSLSLVLGEFAVMGGDMSAFQTKSIQCVILAYQSDIPDLPLKGMAERGEGGSQMPHAGFTIGMQMCCQSMS